MERGRFCFEIETIANRIGSPVGQKEYEIESKQVVGTGVR